MKYNILLKNKAQPIRLQTIFVQSLGFEHSRFASMINFQIEYCSTDAHDGSKPSFRGDLQILIWCLCHWAAGNLPWIKLVKENMTEANKNEVAKLKEAASKNPDKFLKVST